MNAYLICLLRLITAQICIKTIYFEVFQRQLYLQINHMDHMKHPPLQLLKGGRDSPYGQSWGGDSSHDDGDQRKRANKKKEI